VPDANSAVDALREVEQTGASYPLLIVDSRMPGTDGFTLVENLQKSGALDSAVIMLTPHAQTGGDARCRRAGVAAHLSKPVKASELFDALQSILSGRCPLEEPPCAVDESPRPVQVLRILLAEDSPVNQAVAVRMLERRGHHVTIANNGVEALATYQQATFDIVLMDVQMPAMDGYETTAAIRLLEASQGGRVPIIAMTAHAMAGDRDRCLAAGMDGYVSKPVRADALFDAIEQVRSGQSPADAVEALHVFSNGDAVAASLAPEAPTIDWEAAVELLGGDRALAFDVARVFLQEYPKFLAEIHESTASRQPKDLKRAAHTLKGAVSHFAARTAYEAAFRLERLAADEQWPSIPDAVADVERHASQVVVALNEQLQKDVSAAVS
jgi:CheY-like chemotaxis protein